jgi:hypothetical protein
VISISKKKEGKGESLIIIVKKGVRERKHTPFKRHETALPQPHRGGREEEEGDFKFPPFATHARSSPTTSTSQERKKALKA